MSFLLSSEDIPESERIGKFSLKCECIKHQNLGNKHILEEKSVDGTRFITIIVEEGNLKLERDVFGSKPVYYLEKDGFYISDRITPLLNFIDAEPNEDVALDYLHSGLVDHRRETFFSGIKQLRPGEVLKFSGEVEIVADSFDLKNAGSDTGIREELMKRLPEGEFVCPVSGGLDSSIIASMADNADFFHVSFDAKTGDEEYFQELKEDMNLEVSELEFEVRELIEFVDKSLEINEYPTSMLAVQAFQKFHSQIQGRDRNLIVDGTGADELFSGYPRFIPYYIETQLREAPLEGLKAVKQFSYQLNSYRRRELLRLITPYGNKQKIPEIDHTPDYRRPENLEEAVEKNLKVYNLPHILHAKDKSKEFYGVETVYPFLSKHFFDQDGCKNNFSKGFTKKPLRDSFKQDLPNKIISRKRKTGFIHMNDEVFSKGIWKEFEEVFSSERFQNRDFFEGKLFYKRFQAGLQGFFKCYRFFCLEKWMRKFID